MAPEGLIQLAAILGHQQHLSEEGRQAGSPNRVQYVQHAIPSRKSLTLWGNNATLKIVKVIVWVQSAGGVLVQYRRRGTVLVTISKVIRSYDKSLFWSHPLPQIMHDHPTEPRFLLVIWQFQALSCSLSSTLPSCDRHHLHSHLSWKFPPQHVAAWTRKSPMTPKHRDWTCGCVRSYNSTKTLTSWRWRIYPSNSRQRRQHSFFLFCISTLRALASQQALFRGIALEACEDGSDALS